MMDGIRETVPETARLTDRVANQFDFMRSWFRSHTPAEQMGYRSALFDTAHLFDVLAVDLKKGRRSKARIAEADRMTRMGNLVWQLREELVAAGRTNLADPAQKSNNPAQEGRDG